MADPDWTDPCAVLTWIRPQYYKVAAGVAEIRVTYAGRDTQYAVADIDKLDALMRRLESECAAKSGTGTPRRAFTAG